MFCQEILRKIQFCDMSLVEWSRMKMKFENLFKITFRRRLNWMTINVSIIIQFDDHIPQKMEHIKFWCAPSEILAKYCKSTLVLNKSAFHML